MDSCGVILLLAFGLGIVGQSKPEEVECEPGKYLWADPDVEADPELKECRNCPPGTFSSTRNRAAYCASCNQGCFDTRNAVVLHHCNSTHDIICQCKDGYFALSDRYQCRKHDACPENCLKYPGSATSDTVCYDPCPTTTSVKEQSVESSTGSTAAFMNYKSVDSLANPSSSLLNVTTSSSTHSSSNQTASDTFLQIVLPVLIIALVLILAIGLIIHYRKKILCGILNLKRACRERIYEVLPVNGVDRHLPVNHPPQPPRRNASLGGNDHDRIRQQPDASDQRPAVLSFESEVSSHGTVEGSLQEPETSQEQAISPDSEPNEALLQVPEAAGGASSEEVEALLCESQHEGSASHPSLHPEDVSSEAPYGQARLLFASADVQDSATGHGSEDLNATSNSEDLRSSQTGPVCFDLQDLSPRSGIENNRRTSTRPCARVQPQVMFQPERNLQANNPQHRQGNQPQHNQLNLQPNQQPGVPGHVVDIEDVTPIYNSMSD